MLLFSLCQNTQRPSQAEGHLEESEGGGHEGGKISPDNSKVFRSQVQGLVLKGERTEKTPTRAPSSLAWIKFVPFKVSVMSLCEDSTLQHRPGLTKGQ